MLRSDVPKGTPRPTFVSGDEISGRTELETIVQGHAQLRRPGLVVHSDRLEYDQGTDVVSASGNVRIDAEGDRYTGTQGRLQVDAFEGFLLQPTYALRATGAHGKGERIDFHDEQRATITRGDYTTCARPGPGWMPDWILRAAQLDVDREEDVGTARSAILEFKGVPILPVPAITFPLSEKRKSGWLPPTFGLDNRSGLLLSLPWYWNIAPNRDATFTPTVMSRRGIDLGAEFRYLEPGYKGTIDTHLMPADRLRHRTRWKLQAEHSGSIATGNALLGNLGVALNLNRVSDNDYWRDFTQRSQLISITRLLPMDGTLSWARGALSANVRVLKWQTLQDVSSPIVPPFDWLPQINARWARDNDRGFDYSIDAQYTRFHADRGLVVQPNANRAVMLAQVTRPLTRPWGFLTPRVQLHASQYQFERPIAGGATSAGRVLPTLSVDSGLVFERPASFFGRAFTQTLEPRLKYVFTPWRDQSRLPLYDTGAYDFNFATIWADNAFVGHDRIADNHLVTAGVTSRLIDPETGAEALRLGVAQRYRFAPQKVVLPGAIPEGRGLSDLMLGAGISWDPRWSFDTVVQYNPETRRSTRNTVQARYSPGPFRTLSAAYRMQRDLKSESLDLGWQWPLAGLTGRRGELGTTRTGGGGSCSGRWYSVGRLNYNLRDRRVVEGVLGFEYDAGCWIGRVVIERLNSSLTSSTKRILFELELVGFSRLGSSPMNVLRNSIPNYRPLGQEYVPPNRFSDYE